MTTGYSPEEWAAYQREWRAKRRRALATGAIDESTFAHGKNGYSNYGCRCEVCVSAAVASGKKGQTERARQTAQRRAASQEFASKRGDLWTGAEMAVATARGEGGAYLESARAVGKKLGRSQRSVEHLRARCLRDPKYILAVGNETYP